MPQCLQTEYDQLEGKYEAEKSRAAQLESSLQKAAEELSHLRVTAVDWSEEKEKLRANNEQLSDDTKVCTFLLRSAKLYCYNTICIVLIYVSFLLILCNIIYSKNGKLCCHFSSVYPLTKFEVGIQ